MCRCDIQQLAGVHNGFGFAGVKTGEAVTPIAKKRGYPPGFAIDAEDGNFHPIATPDHMDPSSRKWHEEDEKLGVWMGDHSHSWLTADEMLDWFSNAPTVVKTGIFDRANYEQWDKKSLPDFGYCGGISGCGIVLINDNAVERESTPNWTHIQCEWDSGLKDELAYFFEEVARLKAEHGTVRFVFGFDS